MRTPEFMLGTASWTDKTLIVTTDFYPPDVKTAEDRLRFYAAQFRTVEVEDKSMPPSFMDATGERVRDVQQLLSELRDLERDHDVADAEALTR